MEYNLINEIQAPINENEMNEIEATRIGMITEVEEEFDSYISLCNERFKSQQESFKKFKKGNTYLLIILGLASSGKSTLSKAFNDAISKSTKIASEVNFSTVSSDAIHGKAIAEYIANHPDVCHKEVFSKINHSCQKKFEDEVNKLIHRYKHEQDKVNLIFLDKNYPVMGLPSLMKLEKDNVKVVAFYPKIYYPYQSRRLSYPFSFNYLIQCYYRLKGRKNHETLDFDKNPHAHHIILFYFTLYRDTDFNIPGVDMYPLTITDEETEIELPVELTEKFEDLMKGISRCEFDFTEMKEKYENDIAEVMDYIEKYYPPEMFSDKRDVLFEEICELLNDKL
jgi:hypothetical protein